MNKSRLVR